jgi:hypothetical protein
MSQAPITAAASAPTPATSGSYQIVGDKTNGYVLFDLDAGTICTFDAKNNQLGVRRPVPKLPQAATTPPSQTTSSSDQSASSAGLAQGIAGNASSGIVYFIGNQMFYLADIGNLMARWKTLREIPFSTNTPIKGICGDVANGIVVHNGDLLAFAPDVLAYPTWQSNALSPRLPIVRIAGDCTNGLVVNCDASHPLTDYEGEINVLPSVYKFTGKPYGPATQMAEPKIEIKLLVGDGVNGFVAFGEHQLYQLDLAKGWSKITSLAFGLNAAVGNFKDGLISIVGQDNFIVSTTDYKSWALQQSATPATAPDDAAVKPATPPSVAPAAAPAKGSAAPATGTTPAASAMLNV